ncbi:MAG TPA: response regulator [Dehalococcoidia bacterium]
MTTRVNAETTGRRPVVLIVDEIPSVIRLLQLELAIQGFDVVGAEVGEDTYRQMEAANPDCVLLEVVLPGLNGFEILQELKARFRVPVIFVTTQDNAADQAYAYELGADDYVVKPFDPIDLGLRINGALHRTVAAPPQLLHSGEVTIDLTRKLVRRGGQLIGLTTNEWALLYALALRPNDIYAAADLLSAVWGAEYVQDIRYLETWIQLLRRKIETDPAQPRLIVGGADEGYSLRSE